MKVRIVEFADEIANYKNLNEEKIVALNTCAQAFLKKGKIRFENSLNFFGVDGHLSVLRKSKKIMEILDGSFNFVDKNNIKASYKEGFNNYLFFYLRYALITLYIIDKVVKKYSPSEIIVPASTQIENFDYYWSHQDRLLGHLVKKYISENKLKINIIEQKREKNGTSSKSFFFKKYFKKIIFYLSFFIFKHFFNKKNIYIVINDSNNFDNIIKKIKKQKPELKTVFLMLSAKGVKRYALDFLKGSKFSFLLNSYLPESQEKQDIKRSLNNFVSSIIKKDLKKEVNYLNVNLLDEVNSFVSNTMLKALTELNEQINFLVKIIKISNPKLMVSQHTLLIGRAFGELGKMHNIPALAVSHGTHVSHSQSDVKYEWNELANIMINKNFPYIAAQNPHMRKFLDDNDYNSNQIINTGPLLYNKITHSKEDTEKLKKKIFKNNSNKKIILHAGTPKMRGSNRLFVYETVDEYINNINSLISIIKKKKNIFFVIKYRKNPRISLKDFKELVNENENCKIFSEGNFTDFLATADMMISYSSTTIDEALFNKVPVLLYDPDEKYSHLPTSKNINKNQENLTDVVFYCSKLNEIDFTVDQVLKNKNEINENKIFWKKYIFEVDNNKNWLSSLV